MGNYKSRDVTSRPGMLERMSVSPSASQQQYRQTRHRRSQPKIKGCYECSQRRINCDRSEPNCSKCLSKGLRCSGLGVRYRFENGIASRGKFVGKTMQEIRSKDKGDRPEAESPSPNETRRLRTHAFDSPKFSSLPINGEYISYERHRGISEPRTPPEKLIPNSTSYQTTIIEPPREEIWESSLSTLQDLEPEPSSPEESVTLPGLAFNEVGFISRWKEFLLSYCKGPERPPPMPQLQGQFKALSQLMLVHSVSLHIAPQMLAIDDTFNGWRHLVLPISVMDDVVMNAVLAASAYHVSLKSEAFLPTAQESYTKAIGGLLRRRDLGTHERDINHYSILTILILLVTAMVTGGPDFPHLFKMLRFAVEAMGDEAGLGEGELAGFLLRQIRKFRVYAEPLLSEKTGIDTVTSRALESFDCLRRCSWLHPEHSAGLQNIKSQIEQAHSIYLCRALGTQDPSTTVCQVEKFKQTAEAYPEGCPGEQVLIWATFIVAAESTTPEHRAFFTQRFEAFHEFNGFANTLKAVELLNEIWKGDSGASWTSLITEARTFIM